MENWMKETDKYLEELADVLNTNFSAIVKNNKNRQREIKDLRKSFIWLAVDVAILGVIALGNKAKIDKIEAKLEGEKTGEKSKILDKKSGWEDFA